MEKSERDFVDTFQIFPSLKKTLPVEYKLHAAALEKEMCVDMGLFCSFKSESNFVRKVQ